MTWLARLLRRRKMEDSLENELRYHLSQHVSDLIAQGHTPDEARRQARIALGGPEQVKEECRDARGTRWLEELSQDIRYGLRLLRQKPGFAAVATITIALGIGASTAIFSAVNPVLFQPLPYPQGNRIMMVWDYSPKRTRSDVAFGTLCEIRTRSRSFESMAAMKTWQPAMTGSAEPERIEGQRVTADYFRVLGVRPAMGRDFDDSDDQIRGPNVVILSDALWRRRFDADNSIVGKQITLDSRPYLVAGVMPRNFENVLAPSAEIWAPLQYDRALPFNGAEWGHHLRMFGRLRSGVAMDQVSQELNSIAQNRVAEFTRPPWSTMRFGLMVSGLRDDLAASVKPMLLAVLGAVLLLLAIACVNVTNLMLARGAQRRSEFAVRAALGAGKMRLSRQLMTESLLLALIGGALGIVVAKAGIRALVALSPDGLPRLNAIGLDFSVLAFATGITTLIGLVVGLIPAKYAAQDDPHAGLQQGSRRVAGGQQWTRRTLTVAEVALAIVLLVGAGLLLRSVRRLFAVPPGFDSSNVITMQVQTNGRRYRDDNTARRFFRDALAAVRQVPGVTDAAFTSLLPLSGDPYGIYAVRLPSSANPAGEDHPAFRYAVSPGYFETMGIALRGGRRLNDHDTTGAPVGVVISESMARRQFPGQNAVGQRIHVGPDNWPWTTVAGIAGNVKQTSLAVGDEDAFYMTEDQGWFADNVMSLVVRTRSEGAALVPAIKRAIWSVDKDQPIVRVSTMDDLAAKSAAERRFAMMLFEAFGIVALALAATGIYGVLSGSVSERLREIGVRAALGATRGQIVALVIRQAMTLTAFGAAIGTGAALLTTDSLRTLLFGVSHLDPVTYIGVILLIAAVSAIACLVPAWRASRVDPAITLRAE